MRSSCSYRETSKSFRNGRGESKPVARLDELKLKEFSIPELQDW